MEKLLRQQEISQRNAIMKRIANGYTLTAEEEAQRQLELEMNKVSYC
jgi:hypothetical protein